ncbi:hypothetical protein BV20DRAFT_1057953 [Pilatotrama ljubarskyi]|nr:hypothetical protein BV20DRAFT_1057953 [Pilatotrama ljubarskyi]
MSNRTAQELNDFIKDVRALGVQIDLNLPRIAVVGNRSADNSSLVETISRINVPRDAGTCTRCPIEFRLSASDDAWTCRISIRWKVDGSGEPARQGREVPFGDPLTDPADVELMLRRAQAAVLNNQKLDLTHFIDKDGEALKLLADQAPLRFSRIIHNDSGNKEVQLVENLVKSYINATNTLILVVLPMTEDLQTQKAGQLAREADSDGSRTIRVLTKPDAIPSGALGLREERRKNITHAEARVAEARYFAETKPWATSAHRHRYGIGNLEKSVAERQTDLIRADLPRLLEEVKTQRKECNSRLDALPRKTAEPWRLVDRLITVFAKDVGKVIQGSPEHPALVQRNKASYRDLAAALRGSAPPFVPFASQEAAGDVTIRLPGALGTLPERASDWTFLNDVREAIQVRVTRELPHNTPYSVKRAFIRCFQHDWEPRVNVCFDAVRDTFKAILMAMVKERFHLHENLEKAVWSSLLELLDTHTKVAERQLKFMLKYESNPPRPATQNTDDLADLRLKYLNLYQEIRSTPPASQNGFAPPSGASAGGADAKSPFFTAPAGNHGSSGASGQQPATSITPEVKSTGSFSNAFKFNPSFVAAGGGAPLAGQGTSMKQETAPQMPSGPGPITPSAAKVTVPHPAHSGGTQGSVDLETYGEELSLMAEIRAYFEISSNHLAAVIDEHLLYAYFDALREALVEKLNFGPDSGLHARCAQYLAERPDVAALREELTAKKQRLDDVYNVILRFCFSAS